MMIALFCFIDHRQLHFKSIRKMSSAAVKGKAKENLKEKSLDQRIEDLTLDSNNGDTEKYNMQDRIKNLNLKDDDVANTEQLIPDAGRSN